MRDWSLAPGDPLSLTLAADARLSIPDYLNDHIWELALSGGEPPPVLIASEMAVVQAVPETKEVAVASDARPTETLKPKDAPPKAEPTKAQGAKKSAGKKSKKKKRKPSKEKKRP